MGREDLVRRAELRKERRESPGVGRNNRERSPPRLGWPKRSASVGKKRDGTESRNRGRDRRSIARGSRSRSVGRRSRSTGRKSRSQVGRTKSEVSHAVAGRKGSRSKDRRSLSDLRKRRSLSRGRR